MPVGLTATFSLLVLCMPTTDDPKPIELPPGYWPEARVAEILAKTETIRLAPDLSKLSEPETLAVAELLAAGVLIQDTYEDSRHRQALESREELSVLHERLGEPRRTGDLLDLYRLFQGPIATTLDNQREAFLPVGPQVPARNVYPVDATADEVRAFVKAHPRERSQILGERTLVRRATRENLTADLETLNDQALDTLHPGLTNHLKNLLQKPDPRVLYAVPQAVAYAPRLRLVYRHLNNAAALLRDTDPEFAEYLGNRARDLLSNDYESGDAAWVTGRFGRLNAQIGSYETYDDALFGVKAFLSLSLLLKDEAATEELLRSLGGLQKIENALPYDHHKRVRDDISVGIYDVIADFGQSRGTNTATILPNDAVLSRKYGRTILLRRNILENADLFERDLRVWRAATADSFGNDLEPEAHLLRTLWHEVGHYLGVDRDRLGRPLDAALADQSDALEEMKADLVSLFTLHRMAAESTLSDHQLRAVQAGGILRTLQSNKPRTDQPYQTMQLAQFNYFLEQGLIEADPETARLTIHYQKYDEVVTRLLREVLAVQYQGDRDAALAFLQRFGAWTGPVHEKLAARIRDAQGARFRIVRYAALGE